MSLGWSREGLKNLLKESSEASSLTEAKKVFRFLRGFEDMFLIFSTGRHSEDESKDIRNGLESVEAAKADLLKKFPRIEALHRPK